MESPEALQQHYNNKICRRKCILWYIEGMFSDIQVVLKFSTMSKCILPCVVNFLPKNSVLVHCIRAYIVYRILVGLTCITESRLEHLRNALKDYQRYCAVSSLAIVCSFLYWLDTPTINVWFSRKLRKNMERILISWSNMPHHMWFRTFERKVQPIISLLGLAKAYNKRWPKHMSRPIWRMRSIK